MLFYDAGNKNKTTLTMFFFYLIFGQRPEFDPRLFNVELFLVGKLALGHVVLLVLGFLLSISKLQLTHICVVNLKRCIISTNDSP